MKFTSIFYKASAVYIRGLPQIQGQTSGKYEVYFDILQSECSIYSRFTANTQTKRAENMKFTSIFYKASAVYIRGLPQIHKQTSGKYEVYFNILLSECSIYSRFTANTGTNERKI